MHYFETPCSTHAIWMKDEVFEKIQESGQVETGGILIGWIDYKLHSIHITEIIPLEEGSGNRYFNRNPDGIMELLKERWDAKQRTYYVGEWHYGTGEDADLEEMAKIGQNSNYLCQQPILMFIKDSPQRTFIVERKVKVIEFDDVSKIENLEHLDNENEINWCMASIRYARESVESASKAIEMLMEAESKGIELERTDAYLKHLMKAEKNE